MRAKELLERGWLTDGSSRYHEPSRQTGTHLFSKAISLRVLYIYSVARPIRKSRSKITRDRVATVVASVRVQSVF